MTPSTRRVELRFAAFFFLIAAVFFFPCLRPGSVLLPTSFLSGFAAVSDSTTEVRADWHPLQWDALAQYYPWRLFARRQLRQGIMPLWNPYQFSGAPFVANLQSAVFYPPNLIFWLMNPARVFGYSAVLHAFLAAMGMFLLARHLGLSHHSSCVAGVAFMFNGFSLAWLHLPTLVNAATWLPWIFLAASRLLAAATVSNALLLSIAFALQLLAGHAQVMLLTVLALGLYVLIEAIRLRPRLIAIIGAILALAFGGCLAAIQLLPTLELSGMSHRTGGPTSEGFEQMRLRALNPSYFVLPESPFPDRDWNPESVGYVGLTIVLLAAIALLNRRQWNSMAPWLAFTAASILFAIGSPLSRLLYTYVPGISQMGGFGRATVILCFAAALLAGFGFEGIAARFASRSSVLNMISVCALAVICLDLFRFCWSYNPVGRTAEVYALTFPVRALEILSNRGRFVFLCDKRWPMRQHPAGTLPPNAAMVYGFHDIQGYDSLQTNAYKTLMAKIENYGLDEPTRQPAADTNGNMVLLERLSGIDSLRRLGVGFVVSYRALDWPGLSYHSAVRGLWIYQVNGEPDPMPRSPTVNRMEVTPKDGLVSAAYYPGWQAWRQQSRIRLNRAHVASMSVATGATTTLVFVPTSFISGMFIALLSIGSITSWATLRHLSTRFETR